MGAVLNTNMIIEIARGNEDVLNAVLGFDKTFYVTSITRFELLVGLPRKDDLIWLDSLIELPFEGKSAEIAAYLHRKLREKGAPMGLRDLFIGAVCLANDLPLITLDSDFEALRDFGLTVRLIR
ncbi:type II toxin-antitoxin system VapC family toxin [Thermococcus gorgonarius]|uniref:Twitching motility protein PilT n=1 Tax=Thermococcus gorgonarius TaxID=71997 RepID=A0A2Z2MAL9_THEGO|nr:type II toxin-antitoxin system VapC family toxin [Thermococcus gorgonarius]ASJ01565.1 twitching motility protein PilT [Thermococcus gorgonarius]